MTDHKMIEPEIVRLYLNAYHNALGRAAVLSSIELASGRYQNKLIWTLLTDIFDDNPPLQPIPVDWLIAYWKGFTDFLGPHSNRASHEVGFRWLRANTQSFDPQFYLQETGNDDGFRREIFMAIKDYHRENTDWNAYDCYLITLEALAGFFNKHFYCQIEVKKYKTDNNLFSFNVLDNTLAPNDDENFLLFKGLIGRFNQWLSSSSIGFEINKEISTHNQLVIKQI